MSFIRFYGDCVLSLCKMEFTEENVKDKVDGARCVMDLEYMCGSVSLVVSSGIIGVVGVIRDLSYCT